MTVDVDVPEGGCPRRERHRPGGRQPHLERGGTRRAGGDVGLAEPGADGAVFEVELPRATDEFAADHVAADGSGE